MRKPEFQKLLNQFEGNILFQKFIEYYPLGYDEFGYHIETDRGRMLVFEIDFISSLGAVKEEILRMGRFNSFIPTKRPLDFNDAMPVRHAGKYKKPNDWNTIRKVANDAFGSSDIYFNFLLDGFRRNKSVEYDDYHPICFRYETWQFIQKKLGDDAITYYDDSRPGTIAYNAGVITQPELLKKTVVELDDGVDYLIDEHVAKAIYHQEETVILSRLIDGKSKKFSRDEVLNTIQRGATFDQLPLNVQ